MRMSIGSTLFGLVFLTFLSAACQSTEYVHIHDNEDASMGDSDFEMQGEVGEILDGSMGDGTNSGEDAQENPSHGAINDGGFFNAFPKGNLLQVPCEQEEPGPPLYVDWESNLMWQTNPVGSARWPWVKLLCEESEYEGYTDWRLPTITELRSLIRGCPHTVVGDITDPLHRSNDDGDCGVWDNCPWKPCADLAPCRCEPHYGRAGGCYWPKEFGCGCRDALLGSGVWSATRSILSVGDEEIDCENPNESYNCYAWYVDFQQGAVSNWYARDEMQALCVRDNDD